MSADQNTRRVAVITGASSGIGEATASALHADGHRVVLLARRGDRINALADELGNGAIAIEADVTDRDRSLLPPSAYTRNSALPTSSSTTLASCCSRPSAPNGAKNTGAWSRPT
jgi:NAD(P)-dependent dehydrogenase (short-subunit alcohol dehydrogenase family)